jgi:tungstate transport system permease protein
VSASDAELVPVILLSLEVTGAALLLASAAGVPLGAWLGLARFRGRRAAEAVVYTGMGIPPVVVGLLVYLLLARGGPLGALQWLFTANAMVLAQTLIALPLVAGITMTSVAAVPGEMPLQLRSLGAGPWQVRLAVVREARAGILLAVSVAFGRCFSEVGAALMVGGNIEGHTRVLSTAIVLETRQGQFGLALALAGWLAVLALLVNLILVRLHGRPAP